jgi:peptidoglycan/xylan/chitin deacetylase (PgdA/CDA1 family)
VRAGRTLTPKVWPNGARVAVCLSFDPDDFSIQLNRGDTNVVGVSLGEYAPLTGIPRLLKLLQKYNIPASFYIPAVSAMMHPEMIQELKKGPYEVGIHGWIHENPETINDEAEEWRLTSQALDLLEKQWGRRPVGNRNPSWTMSQYTIGLLKKANLLYDTSLQAMDQPHDILLDGQSTGIIELPVNWILDDPLVGPTGQLPQPRLLMKTFQDDFDVAYKEGTLFMLTMHPHTPQRSPDQTGGAHRLHEVEAGRLVRRRKTSRNTSSSRRKPAASRDRSNRRAKSPALAMCCDVAQG